MNSAPLAEWPAQGLFPCYEPRLLRSRHFVLKACCAEPLKSLEEALEHYEDLLKRICVILKIRFGGVILVRMHPVYFPVPRILLDAKGRPPRILIAPLQARGPYMAHEITHAVRFNSNRFLAEGLAVAVQHRLFPDCSWPLEIAAWARALFEAGACLLPLELLLEDPVEAKRRLAPEKINAPDTRLLYVQAGSFCKHLMESYGMQAFKRFYDGLDRLEDPRGAAGGLCKQAFGLPLKSLEEQWKASWSGPALRRVHGERNTHGAWKC